MRGPHLLFYISSKTYSIYVVNSHIHNTHIGHVLVSTIKHIFRNKNTRLVAI